METKHTPGPWGCLKSETGPWAIFGSDGIWVATTCKKQWKSEDLANATLISAAPELLAALLLEEEISKIGIINASNKGLLSKALKLRSAAIAKATGSQP